MRKKESNYIFFDFLNKENITKLNNFIKNNLWLTPLIYIVGTLTLLIRNEKYGLQFAPISLLQFALILVYLVTFFGLYFLIILNIYGCFNLIKSKEKHKIFGIFLYVIIYMFLLYIVVNILFLLIDDKSIVLKILSFLFILWPIINAILIKKNIMTDIITVICFTSIIMEIPMSMGGLKGQEVIYHCFDTRKENKYIYYGNYEGLYQFVSKGKVILLPIDSGYIEYKK